MFDYLNRIGGDGLRLFSGCRGQNRNVLKKRETFQARRQSGLWQTGCAT